jgi:hypothetical protein
MANVNTNPIVKLITTVDGYKLVVNGTESEVTDFGEPLEFMGYLAHLDLPAGSDEAEDVENCLPDAWVYKATPLADVEPEEEDDDDEDDEDDDDDEGEEEETETESEPEVSIVK